jgi:hypothetical protein
MPRRAATILFVKDPERGSDSDEAILLQSFGLMRLEAALSLQILKGDVPKATARQPWGFADAYP